MAAILVREKSKTSLIRMNGSKGIGDAFPAFTCRKIKSMACHKLCNGILVTLKYCHLINTVYMNFIHIFCINIRFVLGKLWVPLYDTISVGVAFTTCQAQIKRKAFLFFTSRNQRIQMGRERQLRQLHHVFQVRKHVNFSRGYTRQCW